MERIFLLMTYASYLLYFFIYFNVWNKAPGYLSDTRYFLQLYVASLLMYFFNPFTVRNYNKFHKQLAFSAGIMLFTSLSFEKLLEKVNSLENFFKTIFE